MELIPGSGAANDLLVKLFGPTCELLGERLKSYISGEAAERNTARVLEKAISKAELSEPGTIPPRIVKALLEEAPYCENELMAEYLGGVMASSRGALSDRAVAAMETLKRLPTSSILLHFLLYRAYVELYATSSADEVTLMLADGYELLRVVYIDQLDEDNVRSDSEKYAVDFWHALHALHREDLLRVSDVNVETMEEWQSSQRLDSPGMVFSITQLGADLFVAAHGQRGHFEALIGEFFPVEYDETNAPLPRINNVRWLSEEELSIYNDTIPGFTTRKRGRTIDQTLKEKRQHNS